VNVRETPANERTTGNPRAVVEAGEDSVLLTVEIAASPDRVFRALASRDVVDWWTRPGVFDTREWAGDVRVGGSWRASGLFRGEPYVTEGGFLEVDPPRRLVHTWRGVGAPGAPTTVACDLLEIAGGTRVRLRHWGFASREACAGFGLGWQTSLERLAEILAADPRPGS
jgi:uncharacterized protein YndB with AHSA1/START domain